MTDNYIVAQEHVVYLPGEARAKLAYIVVFEWPTFETTNDAHDFIKKKNLPLGWVVMKQSQLHLWQGVSLKMPSDVA